jgi:hypothetical protein
MAYCTFATGKWNCFRGENAALPLLERKLPEKAMFVVNGVRTFSYEEIKLRGVDACIGEIRRLIKDNRLGKLYREAFGDVDEQYFTENDFGLLASYFDQFMKDVYSIMNPKVDAKAPVFGAGTPQERKSQLAKKQVDLSRQIQDLKEELKKSEDEANSIDLESIDYEVDGGVSASKVPVPGVEKL